MKAPPSPIRALALALALAAAASGCRDQEKSAPAHTQQADAPAAPALGGNAASEGRPLSASRALKITAEATLAARDVPATVEALRAAVAAAGGYVSDARTGGAQGHESADLEARIPVDKLATFREAMGAQGEIVSESEKAEDVTEQRADLKARLRNAQTQEKRLLDLLSDRTGTLVDVIAAEKALGEARDQIERLQAQDTLLEGQIALATVKLHVVPKSEPLAALSVGDRLLGAGARGIELAGSLLVGLGLAVATAGPSLVILALIAALFYLAVRKLARRAGAKAPSPAVTPGLPRAS